MKAIYFLSPILMLVSIAPLTSAATYVVDPDGTGDFPTIQAAIDAAVDGDVIELTDGTFTGAGNHDIDYRGKAIRIASQSGDPLACVIDCEGFYRGFHFRSAETSSSVLSGITIANGYSPEYGGGIFCEGASPYIERCNFLHNLASYAGGGISCMFGSEARVSGCLFFENVSDNAIGHGGGMHCGNYSSVEVRGSTFIGNHADTRGGGFHSHQYSTAAISGCTFYRNSSIDGSAIGVRHSGSIDVSNCIVVFNDLGSGLHCDGVGTSITISCSDVYGNDGGDWVGCIQDQYGVNGNFADDPLFCDVAHDDLTLCANSPCAAENNPDCGQIGAHGIGCDDCGPTPSEATSWGAIRIAYN